MGPLQRRLEDAGHACRGPGFGRNLLVRGELRRLVRAIDEIPGPVVLVGHSAGGLLSVLAARRRLDVAAVIGLGSAVAGRIRLDVPWFEARSVLGLLAPLWGPDEVRVFPVGHAALPMWPCVQRWVIEKLEEARLGQW